MNELVESLKKRTLDSALFYHEKLHFTCQDFFDLLETSSEILACLKGKNVVIQNESRLNCAILSLMLNNCASQILFLPKDISDDLQLLYLEQAKIDYVVNLVNFKLVCHSIHDNKTVSYHNINDVESVWIIPTSGTTNIPKLIHHSFASLTKTTKRNTDVGINYVWGLVYDIYRFAGMQVFLQAMLSGSRLIVCESDDMLQVVNLLKKYECNALSATPSFWRKMLMCPNIADLKFEIITLGGEIVDDAILSQLKCMFPVAKILHIYASTETGVGFSVHDGMAGFPLSYLNQSDLGLSINQDNVLCITNDEHKQINTGDMVEVKNERVYFLGRETGTINVGGNKVLPEEVENCILALKYVKTVKVYAKKSSFLGNVVCADIVLSETYQNFQDMSGLKNEILAHCRELLSDFKVPAKINFVENIELTASGKLKR